MESTKFKFIQEYYYDPKKILGSGSFGKVYKAFREKDKQEFAVKVIPTTKIQGQAKLQEFLGREIYIQKNIENEHVVRILNVKRTQNNLYIFTDFCEEGDLEKKIRNKHPFSEQEACSIISQIADAFLAMGNIMHRDIKPANIFLSKGKIKVADFGFAKHIDEAEKTLEKQHTLLGTPLYMSPQILNETPYSAKCDVWSTGCLFYELLFGTTPWTGQSPQNLSENIKIKPLNFLKEINENTKDLLTKMLQYKEADRISWKEIIKHPALKPQGIADFYYNTEKPLVQNAFGSLYQARHKTTQKKFALQVIPRALVEEDAKLIHLLMQEINTPKSSYQKSDLPLLEVKKTVNNVYVFTDLYKEDLEKIISRIFL